MKMCIAGFAAALVVAGSALAQNVTDADFAAKPAWEDSGLGSVQNVHNNDIRHDWDTGRRAIPGGAAQAQADNPTANDSDNSVISRPSSTLVDPNRTLP